MKQFIVLAAILPILLLFVAQATLEGVRGLRMNAAEDAVRAFCIEASYYDGGGAAEADALRAKLARIFKADASEIYIELNRTDKAHITWRVSFPVGDIMAGARLMGLSPSENRGRAEMSGTIVIAPKPPPPIGDPGPGGGDPQTPDPEDPDEHPEPGGGDPENPGAVNPDEGPD